MSEFGVYLGLGFDHILDRNGYDHILFVISLCLLFRINAWKRILMLVTAFTIGHTITLALATIRVINFNEVLIERLIPITILITAISNLFVKEKRIAENKSKRNFYFASIFGLIHGLGFSNFLKATLGKEANIIKPLLAFNVGLEVGQIIIVGLFLGLTFIFVNVARVNSRDWRLIISSAIAGIALMLLFET